MSSWKDVHEAVLKSHEIKQREGQNNKWTKQLANITALAKSPLHKKAKHLIQKNTLSSLDFDDYIQDCQVKIITTLSKDVYDPYYGDKKRVQINTFLNKDFTLNIPGYLREHQDEMQQDYDSLADFLEKKDESVTTHTAYNKISEIEREVEKTLKSIPANISKELQQAAVKKIVRKIPAWGKDLPFKWIHKWPEHQNLLTQITEKVAKKKFKHNADLNTLNRLEKCFSQR